MLQKVSVSHVGQLRTRVPFLIFFIHYMELCLNAGVQRFSDRAALPRTLALVNLLDAVDLLKPLMLLILLP